MGLIEYFISLGSGTVTGGTAPVNGDWILATGYWNSSGVWDNNSQWKTP